MNQRLKGIAYIAEITWDEWRYKIVRLLRRISDYFDEDLLKERELEQQRRHREFEAHMKKYLECIEKAKAEEEALKVAEAAKKKANEAFKLTVDGDFGPKTIKAVQHILGCKEDGICGTETIKAIQKLVGAEADGIWGTQTSKALQKFLGVEADGVAGPQTFKAFQKWANKELGF